jgi:uncharacterized protein
MTAAAWRRTAGGLLLDIKITPNAKADKADGLAPGADGRPRLLLRIQAPPVDGKAVIAWLAKALRCPRAALAITTGQTSRQKRVIWSDPPADAEARLEALVAG